MPVRKLENRELLLEERPTATLLVNREGRYIMEQILCEPVELTEFELDAVAGGNPFSPTLATVTGTNNAFNFASFNIGVVQGDASAFAAINVIGQNNT
jgi:hypothetical protein